MTAAEMYSVLRGQELNYICFEGCRGEGLQLNCNLVPECPGEVVLHTLNIGSVKYYVTQDYITIMTIRHLKSSASSNNHV